MVMFAVAVNLASRFAPLHLPGSWTGTYKWERKARRTQLGFEDAIERRKSLIAEKEEAIARAKTVEAMAPIVSGVVQDSLDGSRYRVEVLLVTWEMWEKVTGQIQTLDMPEPKWRVSFCATGMTEPQAYKFLEDSGLEDLGWQMPWSVGFNYRPYLSFTGIVTVMRENFAPPRKTPIAHMPGWFDVDQEYHEPPAEFFVIGLERETREKWEGHLDAACCWYPDDGRLIYASYDGSVEDTAMNNRGIFLLRVKYLGEGEERYHITHF